MDAKTAAHSRRPFATQDDPSAVPANPDRRARLLAGVEAIYLAEGFRASTVGGLAARLRCSRRALYELAPSKEELFLLVLRRALDEIWQRGLEAERTVPDLRRRIRWYVESALLPLGRWSPAFLADIAALPSARTLLDLHLSERMARLEDTIRAASGSGGAIRPVIHPKLVAEMIHASAARFCEPDFLAASGLALDAAIEQMCSVLWDGLLRPE